MEDNALKTEYDAVGNVINPVTPASPVAPVKDTKTSFSPEQQAQYDKTLAMFSTPTIPVDNLQNVVPPPTLPTPPTTTKTGGALVNPPPEPTPAPEAEKVTLKQQLEKGIAGLFGNKIDTSAEKERLQIEEKEKKSRDQYNRITQLDQNYKKQVEEIEKNAQGGLESGMNAEINRLNKDYARTRADEMISYNILQGDYQAAEKTLADYKTDLQDQRKWEADTLQMAWNFVQNDLTESEKLEIQQAFDEKKSKQNQQDRLDELKFASKLRREETVLENSLKTIAGSASSADLLAYAQDTIASGKLPTVAELKQAGLSAGQVLQAAKEMPKATGEIVDIATGIKSPKLSSAQIDGFAALKDLDSKLIQAEEQFKELATGLTAGIGKTVFYTEAQQRYDALKSEIVDLLARARSGAALTEDEVKNYSSKLPGRFNKSFFLGGSGEVAINSLRNSISDKLDTSLRAQGASMYGFSKVKVGGQEYKVGDEIEVNGVRGRINPDGTITQI